MSFTVEDVKRWVAENREELDKSRLECEDECVRMFNRISPGLSQSLWGSGCWLGEQLRTHGATDEQIYGIQIAYGQRSFMGDTWQAAVDYANEFAATGDTQEKGGAELAEKRNREIFGY